MDPNAIEQDHTTALDELLAAWAAAQAAQVTALVDQVAAAVAAGDTTALATLAVDRGPAAEVLATAMVMMAGVGAAQVVAEAAAQGVTVAAPAVDEEAVTELAATVAALMGSATADAAGREALRVWTPGRTGDEVGALVREHMESLTDAWPREQLGGALWTAQAHGRIAVMEAAPVATYASSEVLDRATCQPCREIDGTVFDDLAAAVAAYAMGAYIGCLGRLRCRGILIATWSN